MRLLLYEHLTAAAGCGPELPASLACEGRAMLSGLIQDCRDLPGLEPHTLVGLLPASDLPATVHRVDPGIGWLSCFRGVVDQVDAVLIIAPEFDRILETLACQVEETKKLLVGCSSSGIALTADKWTCGRLWESRGIATPASAQFPADGILNPPPDLPFPMVLKPRDGAGSIATIFIPDASSWDRALAEVREENPGGHWIAQVFAPGQPASVACFVHQHGILTMPAVTQRLSNDGRFRYKGGELPLVPVLAERAQGLAKRAVAAIDGLRGYIGVDLVLGAEMDGQDDRAIELNPRITTSYLGLRALCRQNLMEVMLAACQLRPLPELSWRSGTVQFGADGSVRNNGQ